MEKCRFVLQYRAKYTIQNTKKCFLTLIGTTGIQDITNGVLKPVKKDLNINKPKDKIRMTVISDNSFHALRWK